MRVEALIVADKAVSALPGVSAVECDPASKQIKVTYDPGQVSLEKIGAVMAEEGYPVAN